MSKKKTITRDALPNYRQIKVKVMPWTDTLPDRLKIWEVGWGFKQGNRDAQMFNLDDKIDNVVDQALSILINNGFHPVCRASEKDYNIILCNDFGDNFKYISELKA